MIEIKNISKQYHQTPVLQAIAETIPAGGVTSIIGPNGAGKSTLLSVIGRLLTPDAGQVLVGFGRYPYTQGRLNEEDRHHIQTALAFLDLLPLQDRYLDELSGGQRQRAYVAMALCQNTDYVLLDEPLNNLDMKHAVAMMKQLRRAADELHKTIILVIHDINFAAAYSDHIIAMKAGQVVCRGGPDAIMRPEVLEAIFDTEVSIEQVRGRPVAIYYH